MGVTEILCSFRLLLEGKTGKEKTESWRLKFLKKFLANNFALSDAEENTSSLLNRVGTTDLPLLRTLLAICWRSREPSFWEVMDSFVLVVNACLAAWRTLLQWLLACLNSTLDWEDLLCRYKQKHDFHELWNEWGLTWYLRWGMYTWILTWINSQNSLATAEALSLKISSYRTSLKLWWRQLPSE